MTKRSRGEGPTLSERRAAWREEIVRRIEEVRRGEVETESWVRVQARLDDVVSGS
ncbi:MAG: hypothetical protein JJ863_38440 [Deltaproteobacteria bacterium]|nr:hypothetical protein [Deltaproteobacteria bacterium]